MPNVLVVCLKRFEVDWNVIVGGRPKQNKINDKFEFPKILDLKGYSFKHQHGQTEAYEDEQLNDLLKKEDDDFVYRLVGVNIH